MVFFIFFKKKIVIPALLILCLCAGCFFQPQDVLRIHFLDVGYGDAILAELPNGQILMIDAGEKQYAPAVVKYLKGLKISRIDIAMITHPHRNHFEGFVSILEKFPIDRVLINGDRNAEEGYLELLNAFKDHQVPVEIVTRGEEFNFPSASIAFEILYPQGLESSPNGNSIVSLLTYKDISILFMGDVEERDQNKIIAENPSLKKTDVIKIPHHGGPLSDSFIEVFVDKTFIISTGPNRWGLPHQESLEKLKKRIYRTDRQGTVILETTGKKISLKTQKQN